MNFGLNFNASQFVTWKEEDSLALAACVLVSVPAIAILSQLVGLNVNPVAVDRDVHEPQLQRDAVQLRRQRIRRHRQRRRFRVDADRRAIHDRAVPRRARERVRARYRGHDDRQAIRGALVRAGDVDLAALDEERVRAGTGLDRRFADLAFRATRPAFACGSPHKRDLGEHPQQPRRHLHLQRR